MKQKICTLIVGFAAVTLLACDLNQFTQTQEIPEFIASLTHQPHPIVAGEPVKIFLTLRKDRSGVTGCRARLGPKSHGNRGESKPVWVDLTEQNGAGVYTVRENLLPTVGGWTLALRINCSGIERELAFEVEARNATE